MTYVLRFPADVATLVKELPRAATTYMAPRLPDDLAQLRALLPQVLSLIRSRRAALLAELAGLGGQAPTAAN